MAKRKFSLMEEVKKPSPTRDTEVSDASDMSDAPFNPVGDNREIRATFIVDSGIIRKLKLIAAIENRKHKDVVGSALIEYIGKWESDHPSVDLMAIDRMVNK